MSNSEVGQWLADPPGQVDRGPCLKAIIREARRRRRRRRLLAATAVLAVGTTAVGLTASFGNSSRGVPPSLLAAAGPRPFVDQAVFRGHGVLAFISQDHLWVLDGQTELLRALPTAAGMVPLTPMLSPDGQWLAYLASPPSQGPAPRVLWIARSDGTGPHQVRGLQAESLFGWSPRRDLLGVVTDSRVRYRPGDDGPHSPLVTDYRPTGVGLVSPDGRVQNLVSVPARGLGGEWLEAAVWSPDGNAVAVSTWALGNGPTTISSYSVGRRTARPTVWFTIAPTAQLPDLGDGCADDGVVTDLAGWWPGWGIAFWVYDCGAVHNLDSTPLEVVTTPGSNPHLIGQTLSDRITDAVSVSASGQVAIVEGTDFGRVYGQGKLIATCERTSLSCQPLPEASTWTGLAQQACPSLGCMPVPAPGQPGSAVSIDPGWSPDGSELAYVKSPAAPTDGNPSPSWFVAHRLYVWNPAKHTSIAVTNISGVSQPQWPQTGHDLLYVNNDQLWLAPGSNRPTEVAGPLFNPAAWQGAGINLNICYYGQVQWSAQFAWWSPR